MATGINGFIEPNQYAREMRMQMENKELLGRKGQMYVGTGNTIQVESGNVNYNAVETKATEGVIDGAGHQFLHYNSADNTFNWVTVGDVVNAIKNDQVALDVLKTALGL